MERLLSNPIDRVLDRVTAPIQDWLSAHPAGYWLVSHPIWLLGLVLILLLLLSGLFGAIAQLTQRLWIGILQAPFALAALIFATTLRLFKLPFRWQAKSTQPEPNSPQDRLSQILARLEDLKQEENELLQEAKAIVSLKNPE